MTPRDYVAISRAKFGCEWAENCPEFQSAVVGVLVRHWMALFAANDGRLPYKREIDPIIIGGTLSRIFLYERLDTGFVCRLAGERISWNYDHRLKGRLLSEILSPSVHEMVSFFMEICLEEPAIYRNYGLLYSDADKREVFGERVFLPLRGDDGTAVFLVGLTDVTSILDAPGQPCRAFYRCDLLSVLTQ
jgi:hypothetical protein